jgi:hypothetical protein
VKAVRFHEYGDLDVLPYEEVEQRVTDALHAQAGAGQVTGKVVVLASDA